MPALGFIGTNLDDTLIGTSANDVLSGLDGNDRIDGRGGEDTMIGGPGNDLFFVDSPADIVMSNLGEGYDTIFTTVSFQIPDITVVGAIRAIGPLGLNLRYNGIHDLVMAGNSADDILRSGFGDDTLNGQGGNDDLFGGFGNDLLIGGTGNDTLRGAAGDDTMSGGAGDDVYHIRQAGDAVVEGAGNGTDTVLTTISYTLNQFQEIETLRGVGSADIDLIFTGLTDITISGNSGNNLLQGGEGNDTLNGNGGNDDLAGHIGNDLLVGGAGNDTLRGGLGDDTMVGGTGDDLYRVRDTTDEVVESAGNGFDTIITVVDYTLNDFQEIEVLRGVSTDDLNLTGNNLDNTVLGSDGHDAVLGMGGNDTLSGNIGNDLIIGGAGDDDMTGGAGMDTFVFQDDMGTDRIQDFAVLEDVLIFEAIPGVGLFEDLTITSVAGGANTLINYGAAGSLTLVGVGVDDMELLEDSIFIDTGMIPA